MQFTGPEKSPHHTLRATSAARINDIIYANGSFVAVGNGALILQSTDGITWNNISNPTYATLDFSKIVYANGQYSINSVVANSYNQVLTSSDLVTWLPLSGDVYYPVNGLYTANNTYFSFPTTAGIGLVNSDINQISNQTSAIRMNNAFTYAGGFQFTSVSQ